MLPRVKKYESNDNEKVIFSISFGVSAEEYKTRAVELLKLFCENEYIGTDCGIQVLLSMTGNILRSLQMQCLVQILLLN